MNNKINEIKPRLNGHIDIITYKNSKNTVNDDYLNNLKHFIGINGVITNDKYTEQINKYIVEINEYIEKKNEKNFC